MSKLLNNKKSIETNGFIFHDNGNHNKNSRLIEKIKTSTVEFFQSIQNFIQLNKKDSNSTNCDQQQQQQQNNNTNNIYRSKSEETINQYIQNHFNQSHYQQQQQQQQHSSTNKKRNILFIFQNLKSSKSSTNLNSTNNSNHSSPNSSPRSTASSPRSTSSPRSNYSTSSPRDNFDITFNMVVEKERVILTVKVPEVGLTKKILFDKVETIKDAILLIIEKLPPGCLDASEYNLYLPQKNQWCKIDSRFSKYQFKENQEIEFKKDSRGGVSHMLSSVGQLLTKPYRTVYVKLPDIVTVGQLPQPPLPISNSQENIVHNASSNSSSLNNSSNNIFNKNEQSQSSSASSIPPIIHRRRTSSFSYDPSIHLSQLTVNNSNGNNSNNSASSTSIQSSSASSPSTTSASTSKSFVIPKLNLSDTNLSTTSSTNSSPRSDTGLSSSTPTTKIHPPPLEHKKSFLKIIGLSPRNHHSNSSSNASSLNNSTSTLNKSQGISSSLNQIEQPTTPRNFGTFVRDNENNFKVEAFDFDDDNTLGEVLNKLYSSKYPHIDKDLLEDYSLITKDGLWLTDKNKTIVELGLKHMEEVEFKRMSQKVKVVFLNKELVLSFNPSDTLKDINYKIIVHYLPSLIKLTRSNSILGNSGGILPSPTLSSSSSLNKSGSIGPPPSSQQQQFRSSLSIEPLTITDLENAQILSSTPPVNHHLLSVQNQTTRSQRSYSDTSPLSFSRDFNLNESNHQTQNIENLINKRKNSISTSSASYNNNNNNNNINSSNDTISSSTSFSIQQLKYPIPDNLLEFKDFKLHLCSKNSNPNINSKFDLLLDERRQLSSFNFWNNIRLHFKNSTKTLHTDSKRSPPNVPYYLTIESESPFSINHVLELEGTLLISDILKQFNRLLLSNDNIRITDSLDEYGLYFDTINNTGGNRSALVGEGGLEYGSSIHLEPYKTLSYYPMIEPLDKLIFKRTNSIFGVDPSNIPSRLDPITNLQIPNILLDLKAKFIQLDGFSIEGIFKSNTYHDPSFTDIVNSLNNNTLLNNDLCSSGVDAIGIACFIKKWYMKLPKKICSLLDDETLLYASTQESTAESSLESIPQPYRSLLLWLVRFLSEVAQSAYTNKMSAKNLAIVIAPNLISISPSHNNSNNDSNNTPTSSSVGKYTSLEKVHQCTLFLRNLIKLKLRENGFLPISSSSISISNNSSSFISITGTSGSVQSSSSPISSSLISRSPSFPDIIEE